MAEPSRDLSNALAADVLLPLGLDGAYSYLVPEGAVVQPGCYVQVPLGPQTRIGIVWGEPKAALDCDKPERLREMTHVYDVRDAPPLPDLNRKFIDWVAAYTLSPPGQVMRMTLRVPAALDPPPVRYGYRASGLVPERLTPQRARVLEVAGEGPAWASSDLASAAGVSSAVVKGLAEAGALDKIALPALQAFTVPQPQAQPVTLSNDQEAASKVLRKAVVARDFSVTLIDGVTGSGKTEVYFEAAAAALASGKQVLLLLPEIALTGQFIARVAERFGAAPAGWHSGMKPRERERVWRGVANGDAKIVVGARSPCSCRGPTWGSSSSMKSTRRLTSRKTVCAITPVTWPLCSGRWASFRCSGICNPIVGEPGQRGPGALPAGDLARPTRARRASAN